MRDLNAQEIADIQAYDGGTEEGGRYIEARVGELAAANIGTACGGPNSFIDLSNKGYEHRKVRGYLVKDADEGREYLIGMIAIKIQTESTALKVEEIAFIRFDSECDEDSTLKGFMMFEDE